MNSEEAKALCESCGFTHIASLDPAKLNAREDVRKMCEVNRCGRYGTSWSCPPACGTVEECARRMSAYTNGVLVQTVAELEDEFDGEGMMEAEKDHKANFTTLVRAFREKGGDFLALGAGTCGHCKKCSYPDAPCRFPEDMVASMEGYGLLVTDVCRDNGMLYYYGKGTLAYTSCVLFK